MFDCDSPACSGDCKRKVLWSWWIARLPECVASPFYLAVCPGCLLQLGKRSLCTLLEITHFILRFQPLFIEWVIMCASLVWCLWNPRDHAIFQGFKKVFMQTPWIFSFQQTPFSKLAQNCSVGYSWLLITWCHRICLAILRLICITVSHMTFLHVVSQLSNDIQVAPQKEEVAAGITNPFWCVWLTTFWGGYLQCCND